MSDQAIQQKLKVTRDQLMASLGEDHNTIRQFERLIELVNSLGGLPESVDTSSGAQTVTLPAISGSTQVYEYHWSGGNVFTLNTTGTDVLDFGDAELTSVTGEGTGYINVSSDGEKWKVNDYRDYGVNSNGYWQKHIDGTLKCRHTQTASSAPAFTNWTFPKAFNSVPEVFGNVYGLAASLSRSVSFGTITSLVAPFMSVTSGDIAVGSSCKLHAEGKWR